MSAHEGACRDCIPCEDDDCDRVAFCVSWPNPMPPCPHYEPFCDRHNIDHCRDCQIIAEGLMFAPRPAYDPNQTTEAAS